MNNEFVQAAEPVNCVNMCKLWISKRLKRLYNLLIKTETTRKHPSHRDLGDCHRYPLHFAPVHSTCLGLLQAVPRCARTHKEAWLRM